MNLIIKNMVCLRCKMVVESVLHNMGVNIAIVELGEVQTQDELSQLQLNQLKQSLLRFGLELMEDKKSIIVEKVKNTIVEMIHYNDELPETNFSDYLSKKLNYDYNYISNLFSEIKGTTIERYIITHKIERAKELLIYNELTLTEIAFKLHYSSVSHLSKQFKNVTGLTPSFFKNMKNKRLVALETL